MILNSELNDKVYEHLKYKAIQFVMVSGFKYNISKDIGFVKCNNDVFFFVIEKETGLDDFIFGIEHIEDDTIKKYLSNLKDGYHYLNNNLISKHIIVKESKEKAILFYKDKFKSICICELPLGIIRLKNDEYELDYTNNNFELINDL